MSNLPRGRALPPKLRHRTVRERRPGWAKGVASRRARCRPASTGAGGPPPPWPCCWWAGLVLLAGGWGYPAFRFRQIGSVHVPGLGKAPSEGRSTCWWSAPTPARACATAGSGTPPASAAASSSWSTWSRLVDFDGFREVVDALGGVSMTATRTLARSRRPPPHGLLITFHNGCLNPRGDVWVAPL